MISYTKANEHFEEFLDYANEYINPEIGYRDLTPEEYASLVEYLHKTSSEDVEYDTLEWFPNNIIVRRTH